MLPLTPSLLLEHMALLESWEERYAYVLDLAKTLPVLPEQVKIVEHIVQGCTAQVWLLPQTMPDARIGFLADSDAQLVRGLIAILQVVYGGQTADVVKNFDIEGYFKQLGLAEHLSPNRRNGFFAMVGRIKGLAERVQTV
jgi:cysteine desulfuration protein SufE